jgi:hypothetical protein
MSLNSVLTLIVFLVLVVLAWHGLLFGFTHIVFFIAGFGAARNWYSMAWNRVGYRISSWRS